MLLSECCVSCYFMHFCFHFCFVVLRPDVRPSNRIQIRNLPSAVTKDEIEQLVGAYGTVKKSQLGTHTSFMSVQTFQSLAKYSYNRQCCMLQQVTLGSGFCFDCFPFRVIICIACVVQSCCTILSFVLSVCRFSSQVDVQRLIISVFSLCGFVCIQTRALQLLV